MNVDAWIRPMRPGDIPAGEQVSSHAFYELDRRTSQRAWPEPTPRPPHRAEMWHRRTAHLLRTDPGGCWVAEADGEIVGLATSLTRELMWILASYAVRPGLQGRGIGRALLDAALQHGRGCLRGMLNASDDPQALRRYATAGFRLHPQLLLRGRVDRALLPVIEHVRDGVEGDRDLLDSLDRRTRGAAHGPDHEYLATELRLLVTDRPSGSGYAYASPVGRTGRARRDQPQGRRVADVGSAGEHRPRRTRRDQPRLPRERLGGRPRDGCPAGRLVQRLPRPAQDEGADAVHPARHPAVILPGPGIGGTPDGAACGRPT